MAESSTSRASSTFAYQRVMVSGIEIHYERMGSGPEVLLLLPGALGSSADFEHQLIALNPEMFTMIAWNPPGYGYSRPPNRNFSKDFFYQDAILAVEFMRALNFQHFSLLGSDDGGTTAMIIASKFPCTVQRLIVFGAFASISKDVGIVKSDKTLRVPIKKYEKNLFYEETYFNDMWNERMNALQDIFNDGGEICKKMLGNIKCPTLILHGMKDRNVTLEHVTEIQKEINGARLEILSKAMHKIQFYFKEEFNALIEKFVYDTRM